MSNKINMRVSQSIKILLINSSTISFLHVLMQNPKYAQGCPKGNIKYKTNTQVLEMKNDQTT